MYISNRSSRGDKSGDRGDHGARRTGRSLRRVAGERGVRAGPAAASAGRRRAETSAPDRPSPQAGRRRAATLGTYLKALRSFDMKPASGGATSSPRISASRRTSSSCSLLRSVGVSTTTVKIRSPATTALQVRHAPAAQADLPTGLGAGRDGQLLVAVEGLERNPGPEGRLGHPHVKHGQEVGPAPGDGRMVAHPHVHVQVPGRPAAPAAGAPAREAQRRAVVDPGRHLDHKRPLLAAPALAPAVRARRGDLLTGAVAAGARRGRDHLAQDRLAHPADLAGAVADGAGDRRGPRPGAGAEAGLAGLRQPHGQLVVHAEDRLGELECHGRLGVLAPSGDRSGPGATAARATPPPPPPKKASKRSPSPPPPNPAKGSPAPPAPPPRHAPQPFRSEHVVLAPAFRVAQRLVGQVDLLELLLRRPSPGLASGCSSRAEPQVGALDLVLAGLAGDPEQFVEVVDVGHSQLTLPVPVPSLSARPRRLLDDGDRGQRMFVVHAGRTQDADRARSFPFDLVGGHHDGAIGQGLHAVLGADRHRQTAVEDVADQGDQHELLLQDVEHLPDGARRRRRRSPCGPLLPRTPGSCCQRLPPHAQERWPPPA